MGAGTKTGRELTIPIAKSHLCPLDEIKNDRNFFEASDALSGNHPFGIVIKHSRNVDFIIWNSWFIWRPNQHKTWQPPDWSRGCQFFLGVDRHRYLGCMPAWNILSKMADFTNDGIHIERRLCSLGDYSSCSAYFWILEAFPQKC